MATATVLLYALLSFCINQAMSNKARTPNIKDFKAKLTMFCHISLHYGDFTNTDLRRFVMRQFRRYNSVFPPSVSILADHVSRIKKSITEQTGEIMSTTIIPFECLDVLKDYPYLAEDLRSDFPQLQPYFDNRPKLSIALSALTTLVKDANRPALTNFTTICQESRLSAAEVKNKFLSISDLAAHVEFNLPGLNLLILTMIGDFYRYAIIEYTCGEPEPNIQFRLGAIINYWTEIEKAYLRQVNYLLVNWPSKLTDDIKTNIEQSIRPGTADAAFSAWQDTSIQEFLEHKYYWNAFRVHVYPRTKVADVERFLCTNADTDPKTACVKGGNKIAVVRWQPLALQNVPPEFRNLNHDPRLVQDEIYHAMRSETWMAIFNASYMERVKLPLSHLRKAFEDYGKGLAGPSVEGMRRQLLATCDKASGAKIRSPITLLEQMHQYFVTKPTDGQNFPDASTTRQTSKSHRTALQLLFVNFLIDVRDLEIMAERCFLLHIFGAPDKLHNLENAAVYSKKLAHAQSQGYEIQKVIFQLNHGLRYAWIDDIPAIVAAWSPPTGSDLNTMADLLAHELTVKHRSNVFNVLAYKKYARGRLPIYDVFHPDYTRTVTRDEYTYIINWADRYQPFTQINNFTEINNFNMCPDMRVLLDRVNHVGVPNGTKSVFIYREIIEKGYYGPNKEKGNTLWDDKKDEYLYFEEPHVCCGSGGELHVAYGLIQCWVDMCERKSYCASAKWDMWLVFKNCQKWATVTRKEVHAYVLVMNSGGGY